MPFVSSGSSSKPSQSGGGSAPVGSTSTCPAAAAMDKTKFPEDRRIIDSPQGKASFPNLKNYEVLDGPTDQYNCIAYSLDDKSQWYEPSYSQLDQDYKNKGYTKKPATDTGCAPGKEKVVVYGHKNPDGTTTVTHAAKQNPDGTWTSKMGQGPLVRHDTADALKGPSYGEPIAVYEK